MTFVQASFDELYIVFRGEVGNFLDHSFHWHLVEKFREYPAFTFRLQGYHDRIFAHGYFANLGSFYDPVAAESTGGQRSFTNPQKRSARPIHKQCQEKITEARYPIHRLVLACLRTKGNKTEHAHGDEHQWQ